MTLQKSKQAMPVIGFLSSQSPQAFKQALDAFHHGLKQTGYTDGGNITLEHEWARGEQDRLRELTADLVRRQVAVIAAFGGAGTALIAKAATATIPIVFLSGFDPVKLGVIDSLDKDRHPNGNLTGVHLTTTELGSSKRLGALRDLLPAVEKIALLVNSKGIVADIEVSAMENATRAAGLRLHVAKASAKSQFEAVLESLVEAGAQALLLSADPYFTTHRAQLVGLAARHAIPAVYPWREYPAAGGLMSYGPSLPNAYRQIGVYAGMILDGAKPSDLPLLQSTTLEMVINLKTAKKLALEVPPMLLARADEVIE
jgi:putative tryptophan/tyrosine transport system substrate-binding protein